jgi:hypothetical protein
MNADRTKAFLIGVCPRLSAANNVLQFAPLKADR